MVFHHVAGFLGYVLAWVYGRCAFLWVCSISMEHAKPESEERRKFRGSKVDARFVGTVGSPSFT